MKIYLLVFFGEGTVVPVGGRREAYIKILCRYYLVVFVRRARGLAEHLIGNRSRVRFLWLGRWGAREILVLLLEVEGRSLPGCWPTGGLV